MTGRSSRLGDMKLVRALLRTSQRTTTDCLGPCVLAIVMMSDFGPDKLPPDARAAWRPGGWPDFDIGSYEELWYGAEKILGGCVKNKQHGWITSGELDAIGVFLWTKGSLIDKRFDREYPGLRSKYLPGGR